MMDNWDLGFDLDPEGRFLITYSYPALHPEYKSVYLLREDDPNGVYPTSYRLDMPSGFFVYTELQADSKEYAELCIEYEWTWDWDGDREYVVLIEYQSEFAEQMRFGDES